MKAIITLTDTGDGGFNLEIVHKDGYSPKSPAHVASYRVLQLMEGLAKKEGQTVLNTTDEISAAPLEERNLLRAQTLQVYEWLGKHFEQIPVAAIESLREILGPLPPNTVNLDALVRPEDVSRN